VEPYRFARIATSGAEIIKTSLGTGELSALIVDGQARPGHPREAIPSNV
jgi:hypothetical protein